MNVEIAQRVLERLQERHQTVGLAEACTGGLIGHLLTEVPGSSRAFVGSIVAYHNSVKRALLDVPDEVLREHGSVSAETVRLMALGVRQTLHTDWGVAVSGILGPTGGSVEKPVGTMFIAVAGPDGSVQAERYQWQEDRSGNKRRTAEQALQMLLDRISDV